MNVNRRGAGQKSDLDSFYVPGAHDEPGSCGKIVLVMKAMFLTRQARMRTRLRCASVFVGLRRDKPARQVTMSMRMIGTKDRPPERCSGNGFSENAHRQKLHKGTQRDTKGHKGTEEDTKGQYFFHFFCFKGRPNERGVEKTTSKKANEFAKSR